MELRVKQSESGTRSAIWEDQHTMNRQIVTLSSTERMGTVGGDWNWHDFFSGATWGLGAGCGISGHPVLCMGALFTGGITMFF